MFFFLHPVISPAAHWHSRDLLPPDHIQSGPASQPRQQQHSYLGDRLISCIPRTHYPPQSVGQCVSFVPSLFFLCLCSSLWFTLLRLTASAPATASSSRPSLLTPPPQTLSTKHSWLWKHRGGARRSSWKPQVSWRELRTLSRKRGNQCQMASVTR